MGNTRGADFNICYLGHGRLTMMPPCGTFEYSTTVPEDGLNALPWAMQSQEGFKRTGDRLNDNRLVGWSPLLYIRDTGLPPDPKLSHPAVYRNEFQLVATDKKYANCETASFSLDKKLVAVMRPGDIFHIARTAIAGVGVSVIRQGKLIFGVGQVTAVPLGLDVLVKTPRELLSKAQDVFRQRDPEFSFLDYPIEVTVGGSSRIRFEGHVEMGGYHVWVKHGFQRSIPGTPECVSISLDEACKWVWAYASAQLLASSGASKLGPRIPAPNPGRK